jgi:hypothetical protein
MPRYDEEAKDACFQLYLKYNGVDHAAIQAGMHEAGYVNFSTANISKWAKERNWKSALKLKIATSAEIAATSAEVLYIEIEIARRRISEMMLANPHNRDLVYQHQGYCRLSTDALARLEAARDNYAGFAKFWQELMSAPSDQVPEQVIRVLTKHTDTIIEWAKAKYANANGGNS